ncbi:MAG TPA: hypothetical protein VMV69_28160 [Pirellulales bacterium]|nr:hypothetical protein [Pirellulales bacterium]
MTTLAQRVQNHQTTVTAAMNDLPISLAEWTQVSSHWTTDSRISAWYGASVIQGQNRVTNSSGRLTYSCQVRCSRSRSASWESCLGMEKGKR